MTNESGLEFGEWWNEQAMKPDIPKGWKLVPIEPTLEMCLANDKNSNINVVRDVVADGYKAMIAAAPQPPE